MILIGDFQPPLIDQIINAPQVNARLIRRKPQTLSCKRAHASIYGIVVVITVAAGVAAHDRRPNTACVRKSLKTFSIIVSVRMVGDLGIEPSMRLREGVTVPCHTLRPVAQLSFPPS